MNTVATSGGITAQMLIFNPYEPTEVLFVHNLLEDPSKVIPIPGLKGQKPPGWGFPGGGVEYKGIGSDRDELEMLAEESPDHWILTQDGFSEEERYIMACARRETRDESGFYEIEVKPLPQQFYLNKYTDPRNGHRKILLHGELTSLLRHPIKECDEVDLVDWFNIRKPLRELFEDRVAYPGFLYWSHARALMSGVSELDDVYGLNLGKSFHPSHRLVFPVGRYDERFPRSGFRIPPRIWYFLVQEMIDEGMDTIGNNRIYEIFKYEVDMLKAREETSVDKEVAVDQKDQTAEGSEEELPTVIDYGESISIVSLAEQDLQWLEWAERVGITEGDE